jgi:SAM-dependent methyltransferase
VDDVANTDQAEFWNAAEADHWVTNDERYDRMARPFNVLLFDAARIGPGSRVLDVGCGCGHTTRDAARRAAPGHVLGVDLSGPMLERARQTANEAGLDNVDFEQADAQVHDFPPAGFDAAISRFGVMFFANPVAAFANIRSAQDHNATLAFVCWQSLLDNDWIATPATAALEHVAMPDLGDPTGPGPFSLESTDRINTVMSDAGYRDIDIEPVHQALWLGRDADDAASYLASTGFAQAILETAPSDDAKRAIDAVRTALEPHATADGVLLGSAAWLVHATC